MTRLAAASAILAVLVLAAHPAGVGNHARVGNQPGVGNDGRVGAAQQVPGTFRARIELVPIDVRVLDRDGNPVTDLTQNDFVVFEDGVRQQIRHFSQRTFTAETPVAGEKPLLRKIPTLELSPQNHRTFLIVMGRGRLQEPSKGVDATIRFVREQLLPQDQVAILAYNRATDFTTDHEQVAQVLERFKRRHESIESKLANYTTGLAAIYGSKEIPPALQGEIDNLFHAPGTPGFRQLPPGRIADSGQIVQDNRNTTDALQRADALSIAGLAPPGGTAAFSSLDRVRADLATDLPFEDYIARNAETMQDLGNLYTGVEYLRYLEGEKHLVFVTERGLFLPRVENDKSLAATANDARVVIDTIQTGGLGGGPAPASAFASATAGGGAMPPPVPGPSFSERFAIASLRNVSQLTGGQSSAFAYADAAYRRVNQATLSEYLLGYYPANTNWDGRYRRIVVRVNRPGVTVLFRHGYFGSTMLVPTDRRAFFTYRRVAAAGNYDKDVKDLRLTVKPSVTRDTAKVAREAVVDVSIDISRVAFINVDDRRVGALDIAVYCGDERERIVGEQWLTMDLKLKEDTYQRALKEGIPYSARVPLRGEPRYVKVIVYDYSADIVGSVIARIK